MPLAYLFRTALNATLTPIYLQDPATRLVPTTKPTSLIRPIGLATLALITVKLVPHPPPIA